MIESIRHSLHALRPSFARQGLPGILLFWLAAALPVFFVLYTRLAWEDFFITYRYSENLASGHGLVYNLGERVYGFTSPLNTLLPALFAVVSRARDYVTPLWMFRAVSLMGLVVGLASIRTLLCGDQGGGRLRTVAGTAFPLLAALEIKTTAFAMSGQEAGLMIGLLSLVVVLAYLGWTRHWLLGGFLWAGLMYTRPDGFIFFGAVAVGALAFDTGSRRAQFAALFRSGLVCVALYLPWLLFAWSYFGTPVPHTIIAKLGVESYRANGLHLLAPVAAGFAKFPTVLVWALAPIYDHVMTVAGGWPAWLHDRLLGAELIAVFYWLLPTRDRLGRMASLSAFLIACYLSYANLVTQHAPWYFPPLAFMSLLALTSAAAHGAGALPGQSLKVLGAVASMAGLGVILGFMFLCSLRPLRFEQRVINGGRQAVGEWLRDHVRSGESVYLEPLGYIGYFSRSRMQDWPGLVSPEVVAARGNLEQKQGYTLIPVAECLMPAWIVARANEANDLMNNPRLSGHYEQAKLFDVRPQIAALGKDAAATGMNLAYPECVFVVLRRNDGSGPRPAPANGSQALGAAPR